MGIQNTRLRTSSGLESSCASRVNLLEAGMMINFTLLASNRFEGLPVSSGAKEDFRPDMLPKLAAYLEV